MLAAAALAAHRVLEPIGLALSRGRELRADAYAVRLTGGADAFVTSMRRLSQTNLVDDRPPRLARCCRRTRRCATASLGGRCVGLAAAGGTAAQPADRRRSASAVQPAMSSSATPAIVAPIRNDAGA